MGAELTHSEKPHLEVVGAELTHSEEPHLEVVEVELTHSWVVEEHLEAAAEPLGVAEEPLGAVEKLPGGGGGGAPGGGGPWAFVCKQMFEYMTQARSNPIERFLYPALIMIGETRYGRLNKLVRIWNKEQWSMQFKMDDELFW